MSTSTVLGPGLVREVTMVLIDPPETDVVTVDEIKTLLGITSDASDDLLAAMRDAVVDTLDLGRSLAPQTWEMRLSDFPSRTCRYGDGWYGGHPSGRFELPYPVLTELTSIKYDDSAGTEHTLVEGTDYRVLGLGGHHRAAVAPVYNQVWPATRGDYESVRVKYKSGYAEGAAPAAIKSAIALGIQELRSISERNLFLSLESIPGVRERRWIVSEAASAAIRQATANLLADYRVWG